MSGVHALVDGAVSKHPETAPDDDDRDAEYRPDQKRPSWHGRAACALLVLAGGVGIAVVLANLRSARRTPPRLPVPSPLLVRAALSAIDLRRRPPKGDTSTGRLADALRSLGRPPAPRVLPFVEIKRRNPRVGDTFGHWWIELDGTESYGWWPSRCPIRFRDFIFGTTGAVNGLGTSCCGGTGMTDPRHGEEAEHSFHPTLMARKSDRRVRADIRRFAQAFAGEWRYSTKPTSNDCRSFQVQLFHAVGLDEGPDYVNTRGNGCPFLALFRARIRRFAV